MGTALEKDQNRRPLPEWKSASVPSAKPATPASPDGLTSETSWSGKITAAWRAVSLGPRQAVLLAGQPPPVGPPLCPARHPEASWKNWGEPSEVHRLVRGARDTEMPSLQESR